MLLPWANASVRLVRRAAAGDARAFAALYRELHPAVHGFVARRIAERADVEDLVAKVFHRLLEHLDRFDPDRASVRGWAIGIARNAVIDHLRTRREIVALDDAADVLVIVDPIPAMVDGRTEAILAAVRALPPATREMLALHFGDGLRYREIAELTGGSEAAVKQRMARALRDLRAQVTGDETSTVPKASHLAKSGKEGAGYAV